MTEKDCLKDGKGDVREQERGQGKRMQIYRNIEKWKNSLREIEWGGERERKRRVAVGAWSYLVRVVVPPDNSPLSTKS